MANQYPDGQQYHPQGMYGPPQAIRQPSQYHSPAQVWQAGQYAPAQVPVQQPTHQQPVPQQQQPLHQQTPQQGPQPLIQQAQSQPAQAPIQQSLAPSRAQQPAEQQPSQQALSQPALSQQVSQSNQMGNLPSEQQMELGQETAQRQFAPKQPEPATSPFVDVYDTPDEITVFADLPGCRKEDINVQTSNSTLFITAERLEEVEGEARPLVYERSKRVERSIELPAHVDVEEAEASCEEGVCKVTLPKAEDDRQRTIGVQ